MDTIAQYIDEETFQVVLVCVIAYSTCVLFVLMLAVSILQINRKGAESAADKRDDEPSDVGYEAAHCPRVTCLIEEADEVDLIAWNALKAHEPSPLVDRIVLHSLKRNDARIWVRTGSSTQ